jgi:hypothetical protein
MAKSRESAGRREREQAKRAKANAKRERRMARAEDDAAETSAESPSETVDQAALLAEIERLHAAYENEEISFDDFEERRAELMAKLQVD